MENHSFFETILVKKEENSQNKTRNLLRLRVFDILLNIIYNADKTRSLALEKGNDKAVFVLKFSIFLRVILKVRHYFGCKDKKIFQIDKFFIFLNYKTDDDLF